jgi:hypothetical protein
MFRGVRAKTGLIPVPIAIPLRPGRWPKHLPVRAFLQATERWTWPPGAII